MKLSPVHTIRIEEADRRQLYRLSLMKAALLSVFLLWMIGIITVVVRRRDARHHY